MADVVSHPCPGCKQLIRQHMPSCRFCWRRLPFDLRLEISRAWRERDTDGWVKSTTAARDWFHEQPQVRDLLNDAFNRRAM